MSARLAADLVVVAHAAFILFVVAGGLLALRWRRLAWVHLPALAWGAALELAGWICPLTPLETRLRRAAGEAGYQGGFIEHYLVPAVYPSGLDRPMQIALGIAVLAINLLVYRRVLATRG